ncbi:toll-like receptor 2 [Anneissia japonica]|uniref:toll-like receptor 2 n=1 Tax=Anneissia japonica TaxID=1529436 RepID=UPI0014257964|nr:toll-like receptor 2 [Anneissia japonica]
MALPSRINLNSQYLFCMTALCFLSCISLESGGYIQNITEPACPEVCSCTLQGLVNCSYRNLTSIPDKNKLPVDSNVYLLQDNNISALSSNSFNTTPNLTFLDFYQNKLIYIDDNAFAGLGRLQVLNISYQFLDHHIIPIQKIIKNWFKGLTQLTVAKLMVIGAEVIEDDAFSDNPNIEEINLNSNNLVDIPSHLFQHLPKLKIIQDLTSLEEFHADDNSVTTLEDNVFKNCLNLKVINLSYNFIVEIPSTVFSGLPNLLSVICSDNRIDNIGDDSFQGSSHIIQLNFDGNLFKTVSKSIGLQHLPNLKDISFYTNPFQCNCDLVWFISWIQSPDVRPYVYNLNDVNCNGPPNLSLRLLLDLDPDSFSCSSHVVIIVVLIASVLVIIAIILYYFRWDLRYLHQRRKLRKQYQELNEDIDEPPNMQGNIFDAFISYSSKDCKWVSNVLHPTLENDPYNFRLCIDYRNFMPGNSIVDNIAQAIRCSRKTIMILTKNFLRSQWCYFELEMARIRLLENSENLFIIVLLERITTKDMPLKLQQVLRKKSYIRWPDNESAQRLFWTKLETELRSPNTIN